MHGRLRHDAETLAETREEHAGVGDVGTTLRYEPVAPFVAFVLLTGCRFSEALSLAQKRSPLAGRNQT